MGHTLRFSGAQGGGQGDGHTIIVKDGIAYGANDRRSSDSKVSVPYESRKSGNFTLEFPLLHLLEQLLRLGVLVRLRATSCVERRIVGLLRRLFRLSSLGHRFLHQLRKLFLVHRSGLPAWVSTSGIVKLSVSVRPRQTCCQAFSFR
jgi:hypothetical protein